MQLSQIERQREKYQRAWAKDQITDEEFTKLMDETRGAYDELKQKIEKDPPKTLDIKQLEMITKEFNDNFNILTQEEKNAFISRFIRKIQYKIIPHPPKNYRNKKGKGLVVITSVEFY
jgi:hypothetical protein